MGSAIHSFMDSYYFDIDPTFVFWLVVCCLGCVGLMFWLRESGRYIARNVSDNAEAVASFVEKKLAHNNETSRSSERADE